MKDLKNYINESSKVNTREECINDYDLVEDCDNATKKTIAAKYGIESSKKDVIRHEILIRMREIRKSTKKYDEEDARYFMRLEDWSPIKMPAFLAEESMRFVLWFQQYMYDRFFKDSKKLQGWIGQNPGNNAYGLTYADKNNIKMYNKVLEFIASKTPKTRTAKDDIFDMLVNKFTELLAEYKKEYLTKVEKSARNMYSNVLPEKLAKLKERNKELSNKLDSLDWRKNRYEYDNLYDAKRKVSNKIENIMKTLSKYTEDTYAKTCVEKATEEFENNIKQLSARIQDEGINIEKMTVKSVHDDPKVFNMKITDGIKNLFCRSIIAAEFSSYMIPHYRFIITTRSKDDSYYKD